MLDLLPALPDLLAHDAIPFQEFMEKGVGAAKDALEPIKDCPAQPDPAACQAAAPKPESIPPTETIAYVLADLAIILIAARIVGGVFVRLGQPRVVGEIIAGILIGPTVLGGHLARGEVTDTLRSEALVGHGVTDDLYPLQAFAFLNLIGTLTLVFFMFLVGLEVQQRFLKGRGLQIATVAPAVVAVPVALGFVIAGILDGSEWRPEGLSQTTHSLVIGAALAVTAFPVMARILQEKRMIATKMGAVGVGSAAVVTPLMFLVLAAAAASAEDASGAVNTVGAKVLWAIGFVLLLFFLVRPFLSRVVLRNFDADRPLSGDVLAILLFGALAAGLAADRIGIHALNGGFLFGACVPQLPGLAKAVLDRMADFVIVFMIPIFLAVAGLQTDFTVLTWDLVPGILLFLAAMIVGKWLVGTAAGMGVGLNWREANTIGVLMNCRGLMILVVAIVAGSFGGITPEMRVVFALGAIVTTLMTGPLVDLFVPKEESEKERDRSISDSLGALPAVTGGPRVVIGPREPAYVAAATAEAESRFIEREGPDSQFLLAHVAGLRRDGDYVGAAIDEDDQELARIEGWLRAGADRLRAAGASADSAALRSPDPVADLVKLAADWAATHAIVVGEEEADALEAAGIDVHRLDVLPGRTTAGIGGPAPAPAA
jgi:Kef-type K+ transport system membrane component KefB